MIPDFDARSGETWSDGSQCWLKSLLPTWLPKAYVLEYEHGIRVDEDFSWQDCNRMGDVLLEKLLLKIPNTEVTIPIALMSTDGLLTDIAVSKPSIDIYHSWSWRHSLEKGEQIKRLPE